MIAMSRKITYCLMIIVCGTGGECYSSSPSTAANTSGKHPSASINVKGQQSIVYNKVRLILSTQGKKSYGFYAELFVRHLKQRMNSLKLQVIYSDTEVSSGYDELSIYAGVCETDNILKQWFAASKQDIPSVDNIGPEGFALDIIAPDNKSGQRVMLAGVDSRGVLFGLGRILHMIQLANNGIYSLRVCSIRTSPRFAVRSGGGNLRQNIDGKVRRKTGARKWTKEEGIRYFESLILNGENTFMYGWGTSVPVSLDRYDEKTHKGVSTWRSELAKRYGVDFLVANSINGIGRNNMKKPEWRATLFGRKHSSLVCPSIPDARKALLRVKEIYFKHCPKLDYIVFLPADVAGCECKKCQPWSMTYYNLLLQMASLVHKYHPAAKVYFANQGFTIADNEKFFMRIHNENPRDVNGYCYAPGGSENSTYGYLKINKKWNIYPGRYPKSSFLKSRLFYLHPGQSVMAIEDISHWKRAENGLPYIDPVLSEVYHRRTFNARPMWYKAVWERILPYCDAVCGYSEGIFDDFNKFLTLRLAWNPDLSAKEIAQEYYNYYCGTEAGKILAEAVFLGEQNYALPVRKNAACIEKFYDMVKQANRIMPRVYRRNNWRFLMLYERATIDLYLLRKLQSAEKLYNRVLLKLRRSDESKLNETLAWVKRELDSGYETAEMRSLKAEAKQIDDELNCIAAIRFDAILKMDNVDSVGINWLSSLVKKAMKQKDVNKKRAIIDEILNYDVVGKGEFYDNCGTLDGQPHFNFKSGELYYGTGHWSKDSRPSQRYYDYSFEAQDGLEFDYTGLDKAAHYKITVIYPNPKGVSFAFNSPNEFEIYADGVKLGRAVPTGKGFDKFSFVIPYAVTKDGQMKIQFRKVPGRARCTCISEIWIRKIRVDRPR